MYVVYIHIYVHTHFWEALTSMRKLCTIYKTKVFHNKTSIPWKSKLLSKHIGMLYLFLENLKSKRAGEAASGFLRTQPL